MSNSSAARLLSLIAAGGLFLSGLTRRRKLAWAIGAALILAGLSRTGRRRAVSTGTRWGTSDYDPLDDALAGTFPASDPPAFQVPE